MKDIYDEIENEIDTALLPGLMDFVRIPNQSRNFDPAWQTDGLNEKVCNYITDWASKQAIPGLTFTLLQEPNRTSAVLGILDNPQQPTALLYAHLDKQPPLTGQWSDGLGPYDPVYKDGKLYGRGAGDDGYASFAELLLAKVLQKHSLLKYRLVFLFETDEESGSADLFYYLDKHKELIGDPKLVLVLDCGGYDYDHMFLTTSMRGIINFSLKVEVAQCGINSGEASGIVPDSFRIARKIIDQIEAQDDGKILLASLYAQMPQDKYGQAKDVIDQFGGKLDFRLPFLPGVQPVVQDGFKQYLNGVWQPELTTIGIDGIPPLIQAGGILRPSSTIYMSVRLPPTLDVKVAQGAIETFFSTLIAPYSAKLTVEFKTRGSGFNCPPHSQALKDCLEKASQAHFGKSMLYLASGGTISILNQFCLVYPNSQILVSGVMGPESNAHAPDENLNVPYLKKLIKVLLYLFVNL